MTRCPGCLCRVATYHQHSDGEGGWLCKEPGIDVVLGSDKPVMKIPLAAGLTVDGQPLSAVLAADAPTGNQAQDVLHAIAKEFGWRTDWATGSPITLQSVIDQIREMYAKPYNGPVHMYLTCPKCNARHIDLGDFAEGGTKSLHHTHSCQSCGLTWRPAVNPTLGVEFLPGFKNR